MYQAGDWVVYGVHGVCRVAGIEKQLVGRKRTRYLVLEPLAQNEARFYLPVENETAMAKLQAVLSRDELTALLESHEIRRDGFIQDENQRKLYYREVIHSGNRMDLLKMVTSLYRYRRQLVEAGKKFHQCDENFLRDAEKLLASEVALVMELSPEEARDYLREHLKER